MPPQPDDETIRSMYAAANDGDFAPFAAWLSAGHVHHLPGVGMEMRGREETVRGLAMMYADLQVQQHPLRIERLGPFVVVFVLASSMLRAQLEGVHVLRLDEDERIAEFWGITTPMPRVSER
jgi:hypothetical protein